MIIGRSDAARLGMQAATARLKRHAAAAREVAYDNRAAAGMG